MPDYRHMVALCLLGLLTSCQTAREIDYRISFDSEEFKRLRQAVRSMNAWEIQQAEARTGFPVHIGIDIYDLDEDHQADVIAYFSHGYFCGEYGCRTDFYLKKGKTLTSILSVQAYPNSIFVETEMENGFHVLRFEVPASPSGRGTASYLAWDGQRYRHRPSY